MKFIAAFRFLTVIPLPFRRQPAPEEMGGSVVYFPVVGLIIGLLLAGLYYLLDLFLPRTITAALIIVVMVLINGAMHIDGFIDTCDGLAGNKPAEERWKVMKDSRVGAFGVVGAVLLFMVKYASFNSLPHSLIYAALILVPILSRWSMVYAMTAYPYARPSGLGTTFKQYASWPKFIAATIFTIIVTMLVFWLNGTSYPFIAGLVVPLCLWLVTLAWTKYLNWKFAGLTGDSYGAVSEAAEVMVLIAVIMLAFH